MFKKKKKDYSELTIESLAEKVADMSDELKRVEVLEKSLVKHEVVLASKIKDIHRLETQMESLVKREEFNTIKKSLKKLKEHEDILFEHSKFTKELVKELDKVKQSHKITRNYVLAGTNVKRKDFDQEIEKVKSSINNLEHFKHHNKKKASRDELKLLKDEVIDRMSQIEYQQKVLITFLKKIKEKLD